MTGRVILLPGDGVGPEVVHAAVQVLQAAAPTLDLTYITLLAGGAAIDAHGTPLRPEDLDVCKTADAVLLGAVGGPAWDHLPLETRPERALLQLRSELGLGISLRPVQWTAAGGSRSPLKPDVAAGADIAFVRELTGGLYFGVPSYIRSTQAGREAVDTCAYSEAQIVAVLEFAFELARGRRGRVTSVDKANVLNTSRLWRQVAGEYAAANPDVQLEHALVDSFGMTLMQGPGRYDVVVTENLFGDILTDLAGVIAGSLGVLPSASLRPGAEHFGMYEPVHGSAPTIAGQGIANPVGCILSVALMLQWTFRQPASADAIRAAVGTVMNEGKVTVDLAGQGEKGIGTQAFVEAIIQVLGGTRGRQDLRHHVA